MVARMAPEDGDVCRQTGNAGRDARLNERGFTMAKAKTRERAATAVERAPKSPAQPATVTDSDVARRAYELYLARGCEDGHDVEDWLQAERELRSSSTIE